LSLATEKVINLEVVINEEIVIPTEVERPADCIGRKAPTVSTRLDVKNSGLTFAMTFLFFALAVSAQTPPPDASLNDNPVYQKNCAKCHGKTAEGRHFGGPSLISDAAMATSSDELRNIITNGKHRMPKYAGKLTPEEIDMLVDQIKTPPKK